MEEDGDLQVHLDSKWKVSRKGWHFSEKKKRKDGFQAARHLEIWEKNIPWEEKANAKVLRCRQFLYEWEKQGGGWSKVIKEKNRRKWGQKGKLFDARGKWFDVICNLIGFERTHDIIHSITEDLYLGVFSNLQGTRVEADTYNSRVYRWQ